MSSSRRKPQKLTTLLSCSLLSSLLLGGVCPAVAQGTLEKSEINMVDEDDGGKSNKPKDNRGESNGSGNSGSESGKSGDSGSGKSGNNGGENSGFGDSGSGSNKSGDGGSGKSGDSGGENSNPKSRADDLKSKGERLDRLSERI